MRRVTEPTGRILKRTDPDLTNPQDTHPMIKVRTWIDQLSKEISVQVDYT